MNDRDITMTNDDFNKVMMGLNVLSNMLFVLDQHPDLVVTDLDGDPFPEARELWDKACKDAHEALGRAKYAV